MNEIAQISIIIPCFNRLELLKETVASVLAQDSDAWELILVDDGSTDGTIEYGNSIANSIPNIQFIRRTTEYKSASSCRNIGASNASAEYLIFMDSDDLVLPNFISLRQEFIQKNTNYDFIVFPTGFFLEKIGDLKKLWNILHKDRTDLERFLNQDSPWHTSGPIWKKDSFFKLGAFDIYAQSAQDWELHVRALVAGLNYLKVEDDENNLNYFIRKHNNSISTAKSSFRRYENRKNTFHKVLKFFIKDNKIKKRYKNNMVAHFYRASKRMYLDSFKDLAFKNLRNLYVENLTSLSLFLILKLKLHTNNRKLNWLSKPVDYLLFKFYDLSNLDFPIDRTKGKIYFKSK